MNILVSTDNHIQGSDNLRQLVEGIVGGTLERFQDRLTRVEVHLSDVNGPKSNGDDKRCVLEARPASHQPIAVTHLAATIEAAVEGAAERMEKTLGRTFGRLDHAKGGMSASGD